MVTNRNESEPEDFNLCPIKLDAMSEKMDERYQRALGKLCINYNTTPKESRKILDLMFMAGMTELFEMVTENEVDLNYVFHALNMFWKDEFGPDDKNN